MGRNGTCRAFFVRVAGLGFFAFAGRGPSAPSRLTSVTVGVGVGVGVGVAAGVAAGSGDSVMAGAAEGVSEGVESEANAVGSSMPTPRPAARLAESRAARVLRGNRRARLNITPPYL